MTQSNKPSANPGRFTRAASALDVPLRANIWLLLAERGRGVLLCPHAPAHTARQLPFHRQVASRKQLPPRRAQCRAKAVHLDRVRRLNPRQDCKTACSVKMSQSTRSCTSGHSPGDIYTQIAGCVGRREGDGCSSLSHFIVTTATTGFLREGSGFIIRRQMSGHYEPSLWLQMSAKARTVAGELNDPELRHEMLRIAESYNAMAERAAVLAASKTRSTISN
jgi:hypothetical protein